MNKSQQALIALIEGLLISALVAGAGSVSPILQGTGPIDWHQTLNIFAYAALASLLHNWRVVLYPSLQGSSNTVTTSTIAQSSRQPQAITLPDLHNRSTMPVGTPSSLNGTIGRQTEAIPPVDHSGDRKEPPFMGQD